MLTLINSCLLSVTRSLSLLHSVQRASGAQKPPVHNIWDREDYHSHPYSAKVRNSWKYTAIPKCLHGVVFKCRNNFTSWKHVQCTLHS